MVEYLARNPYWWRYNMLLVLRTSKIFLYIILSSILENDGDKLIGR